MRVPKFYKIVYMCLLVWRIKGINSSNYWLLLFYNNAIYKKMLGKIALNKNDP